MNLPASIGRSLRVDMQAELRNIERALATGTRQAGRGFRTELHRQVTGVGFGQRLANSWRDRHYPNQRLDAASLVYTKAPQIMRAFDEGAVIHAWDLSRDPDRECAEEGCRRQANRAPSRSTVSDRCASCRGQADRHSWSSMACNPRSVARAGRSEAFGVRPSALGAARVRPQW
jgi:hypothetical protein